MKIISVVGARPNFMKIAPFIKAIKIHNQQQIDPIKHLLVHTGQHYDDRMSKVFFETLDIPRADINLGIGSGTHAEQVGNTMIAFEKVLLQEKPDWVIVLGDVNATLACSVTAKKLHIKVCHIEAGLRSGDERMPEEINRLVTDRLSDLLLTPDKLSIENLQKEGVPANKIKFVGNIMIDTLEANRGKASQWDIYDIITDNLIEEQNLISDGIKMQEGDFALMTMHRPSNVDTPSILEPIIRFLLDEVAVDMPLLWPIHPRTQKQLKQFGLWNEVVAPERLILLHPLGYHQMLKLNMAAKIMLTDSGGLQEECTVLGTPCLTLRWNTERPITLREHGGASVLVGNNIDRIREEYQHTLHLDRQPEIPELWDGKTAERCLSAILAYQDHNGLPT
ncbi:MAG: UDP-N-acetylglucosamine 2-epimerase (non-hydrolyzing) [Bacteroidetes bacterium]|nr:MAG: UDP-N-acetylglucosamine 2-epimerase (non-hydrolyzing) [Bacteroidota bacterium]